MTSTRPSAPPVVRAVRGAPAECPDADPVAPVDKAAPAVQEGREVPAGSVDLEVRVVPAVNRVRAFLAGPAAPGA